MNTLKIPRSCLLHLIILYLPFGPLYSAVAKPMTKEERSQKWRRQALTAQYLTDSDSEPRLTQHHVQSYSSHKLKLNPYFCHKEQEFRKAYHRKASKPHIREYQIQTALLYSKACGVYVHTDAQQRLIGLSLSNDSDNAINPQRRTPYESKRLFTLRFEERVKQNITLRISDQVGISGEIARDFMETTMVFIPRKVLPYIEYDCPSCTRRQFALMLPTAERIVFDAVTYELKGGVLREEPIDLNPNERLRRFARLSYDGHGIMIRADRRGGLPERIYRESTNRYEDIRQAVIRYQGRECRVPKNLIWNHTLSQRAVPYFKYATDQEFLSKVIRPYCQWSIKLSDLSLR